MAVPVAKAGSYSSDSTLAWEPPYTVGAALKKKKKDNSIHGVVVGRVADAARGTGSNLFFFNGRTHAFGSSCVGIEFEPQLPPTLQLEQQRIL